MIPLTDTTRRRTGYLLIALVAVSTVLSVPHSLANGDVNGALQNVVLGFTFAVVAALAVRAAPRNGVAWALIWFAVVGSSGEVLGDQLLASRGLEGEALDTLAPSSLSVFEALVVSLAAWMWLWLPALLVHLIVLFPAGRATSAIARWLMWVSTAVVAFSSMASAIMLAPWVDSTYGEMIPGDGFPPPVTFAFFAVLALISIALVDLIIRFRRSSGIERLQYKWVATALLLFGLSIVLALPLYAVGIELPEIFSTFALAAVPASIGIGITKYRLFDIDLVISRTLVFVVLVGFITVVYAAVVVGIGSAVGGSSVGWSIAATALVAVVFEPVRDRVQRWVNRLVYGRRATPYEVLSDLTGRLAATEREEGLLDRMAQRLAEGTGADRAVVWVGEGDGFHAAACEPAGARPIDVVGAFDRLPGAVVPIVHDGVVLGALSVESRRGDALTPTEQRLVEDLAGSAGLLMRRLHLDAALEQKATELEESRRRLVNAQDVERRRLERELNEGAQQQVVALKVQLGLAEQRARGEGSDKVAGLIAQMAAETQDAIDQIRALANGIYPPLLEAEGLAAAVTALAEAAPVEVRVEAEMSHRYPLPIEGAVYFCISEALTNAVKHGSSPIAIDLSDASGDLVFSVSDAGPGFDPDQVERGSGLNNMADRLDALAGSVTIESTPGNPTIVTGRVPVIAEAGVS